MSEIWHHREDPHKKCHRHKVCFVLQHSWSLHQLPGMLVENTNNIWETLHRACVFPCPHYQGVPPSHFPTIKYFGKGMKDLPDMPTNSVLWLIGWLKCHLLPVHRIKTKPGLEKAVPCATLNWRCQTTGGKVLRVSWNKWWLDPWWAINLWLHIAHCCISPFIICAKCPYTFWIKQLLP